jgi:hypothetical protein
MRRAVLIALLGFTGSCGGKTAAPMRPANVSDATPALDVSDAMAALLDASAEAALQCSPTRFDVQGPPGECRGAPALVFCPSGSSGCLCLSDGAADSPCSPCLSDNGGTCRSECAKNEFGLACHKSYVAPPYPPPSPFVDTSEPPDACSTPADLPAGVDFYCCPCE